MKVFKEGDVYEVSLNFGGKEHYKVVGFTKSGKSIQTETYYKTSDGKRKVAKNTFRIKTYANGNQYVRRGGAWDFMSFSATSESEVTE